MALRELLVVSLFFQEFTRLCTMQTVSKHLTQVRMERRGEAHHRSRSNAPYTGRFSPEERLML